MKKECVDFCIREIEKELPQRFDLLFTARERGFDEEANQHRAIINAYKELQEKLRKMI